MNKPYKSSLFRTSLLVALMAGSLGAQAAGLGKLTVYSAIGQPLNAELGLNASNEELRTLSARLASFEAFKDAGVDYAPALSSVRFSVAKSATGQPVLRMTSDKPINEPFLHFLVELNWTAGRMVREYTFLLDPPEMIQPSKPASVVAPATPKAQETEAPAAASAPGTIEPRESAAPAVPGRQPVARTAGDVQVKAGDTLGKIAREYKPESVSLDQMLVALFNSNRDAFIGNNMNRLRAGKILRLPEAEEVSSLKPQEAHQVVVAQAADFNAYRRRLAAAAASAPAAEAPVQQQAGGKIAPRVEEKAPPPARAGDKLEVSRTEAAKSGAGGKGKIEEELVAREKALREASERIAQLEKNLDNLKQLAELKSQAGAQMQQQAKDAKAPAPAPTPAPAATPAPAPAKEQKPEAAAKPAEAAAPAPAAPQAPADAAKPAETAPAKPAEAPAPTAEPPKPAAEAPKPAPKQAVPPPAPQPGPSFVEDNPEVVFGGGALIALLLGYFGFSTWRKKKQATARAAEEPVAYARPAEKLQEAQSVAAAPAATEDVSVLGDFSSGVLTTEESVDPVAEADVLMAYGRDRQAEEILLEGLKTDSTRTAIYAKLLELYANRKDEDKFEAFADDLYGLSNGEGEEWNKVTALARGMGLSSGLFASAAPVAEPVPAAVSEMPPAAATAVEPAPLEMPAPAAQQEELPAAEMDASSLDFDLDLGTTSMPAAAAAAEKTAEPAPVEESSGLDFDFDLGTSQPEPAAAPAVAPEIAAPSAGNEIEFSPAAPELPTAAAPVAPPAADSNEISFDLDLGSDHAEAEAAPAAAAEPLAAATGSGLDFDLDMGSAESVAATAPQAAEAAPALELPDISLDLEIPGAAAPALDVALPGAGAAASGADNPEAATKLELAQAYEEMGDREGAKELLTEVLSEGSPAQQALARARLDQLSA